MRKAVIHSDLNLLIDLKVLSIRRSKIKEHKKEIKK